ncbi:hypothetical protein ACOMHN_058966 [Nucella lapillus]
MFYKGYSASILNVAQTQELRQEETVAVVETTTQETAIVTDLHPQQNPAPAGAPQDEESDEEPYSMIPENLPLPDDNCVEESAPFPDLTTEGEDVEREGSADRTLEGVAEDRAAEAREGPGGEPMTTDLDEGGEDGGEDVLITPTPSPVAPELTEEQDDVDSVRTVEDDDDDDSDNATRRDENSALHGGNCLDLDLDPISDPSAVPGEESRHKSAEDSQHGENNNRTCPDSELTNPIEI